MHLDGENHAVAAGGIAVAPRGVPHAFMVTAPGGARMHCLQTPGCCQAFYWDASGPIVDSTVTAETGPIDMGRVQASAEKNGGIEILGPPPSINTDRRRPRVGSLEGVRACRQYAVSEWISTVSGRSPHSCAGTGVA